MHLPAVNLRIYQPPRREIDEIEDSRVKAVTVQGGNLIPHEPHGAGQIASRDEHMASVRRASTLFPDCKVYLDLAVGCISAYLVLRE